MARAHGRRRRGLSSIQPMRPSTNRWASSASLPNHMPRARPVERDVGEPGLGEQAAHPAGVGERERAGVGRRRRQVTSRGERPGDLADPLVAGQGLPGHEQQPSARAQGAADVGERGDVVAEEHRAVRLMATSKASGSNGWICASACANVALVTPSSAARRRAMSSIRDDRSTPSAEPADAARAASRVVCPVPQPTSSTRSPSPIAAAVEQPLVVGGDRPVEVLGVRRPSRRPRRRPRRGAGRRSTSRLAAALVAVIDRPPANLPLGVSCISQRENHVKSSGDDHTSYAILGLLAVKPWTTHELVQQVDRSLRRIWPRAQSKLYEEPKKLVAHGYAEATDDSVGRRRRTRYTITAKAGGRSPPGCRSRATGHPSSSSSCSRSASPTAAARPTSSPTSRPRGAWVLEQNEENLATARAYLEGTRCVSRARRAQPAGGPLPHRLLRHGRPLDRLGVRARRRLADDVRSAPFDVSEAEESLRRVERVQKVMR